MRKAIIGAAIILLLLAAGVWFLFQDPAGSDAYSVLAEEDADGTSKCGLVFLDALAQDPAGNDLYFKVTASIELLEGTYPVVLFAVEGLRVTAPETQSGESLRVADASLVAGGLDTRRQMRRPEGDVDAFFATSTKIDEMVTLPIEMLEGANLTVRLADEAEERPYVLPRVGGAAGDKLITCFQGMQARVNAVAAGEKSGADGKAGTR